MGVFAASHKPSNRGNIVNIGIIGAGLQAIRRSQALVNYPHDRVVAVSSKNIDHSRSLASRIGCDVVAEWQEIVRRNDIDAIMVCTTPDSHAEISIQALRHGKHVLCEKPLTRTIAEGEELLQEARKSGKTLKCGFNHRHHPAIAAAKKAFDDGILGKLLFMRSRYGICGRPGYEQEWRANPSIVGGGQLMENGIHSIDLFRWFAGEFSEVTSFCDTKYWKIEPLEDTAFVMFRTADGVVASLHNTLMQWKNLFSFEVFGENGYMIVEGLGGAYGVERLTMGKTEFTKPFSCEVVEFRGEDRSWLEEWKEFRASVHENREPLGSAGDGLEAMKLVLAAYRSSNERKVVNL